MILLCTYIRKVCTLTTLLNVDNTGGQVTWLHWLHWLHTQVRA